VPDSVITVICALDDGWSYHPKYVKQFTVIIFLLAYEDGTECSETSAYKIQTPGNSPEENIQHTEHGESLKSRTVYRNIINCT